MPSARDDSAPRAASDSYASIWSALTEAQRAAILATINKTEPPGPTPAVHETMDALRRMGEDPIVDRPPKQPPPTREPWGWHPLDNGFVTANFDPALVVGGNAPPNGVLVCQQVTVPRNAPIAAILLDVVHAGSGLTSGAAAVYESDGTRSGYTADQATAWSADGLCHLPLVETVRARPEPRTVWVGFTATGRSLPGFAVPWVSGAARPNLGLPSPGPQRAGQIAEQTGCPDRIVPATMTPAPQYWVALQ